MLQWMTSRNQPTTNLLTTQDSFTLKVGFVCKNYAYFLVQSCFSGIFPFSFHFVFAHLANIIQSPFPLLFISVADHFDTKAFGNTFQTWPHPLPILQHGTNLIQIHKK